MKKIINKITKNYGWLIVGALLFFVTVSILNARNDALTFDEVAHIPAGYSYLLFHDMRLNPEHPPLIKDLAALPLLFFRPQLDIEKDFWQKEVNGQWEAGHNLLWQEGNNPDQIAFWSRLPIILISLLLGLFIFKWSKELAGLTAGLLAALIFFLDPNILGHNHLVTTDVGIAAFLTFSLYYFAKFIVKPSWRNTILAGLFLGLAHTAKFSSVTLLPLYTLVVFAYPLLKPAPQEDREDPPKKKAVLRCHSFLKYLFKGGLVFVFSVMVIWLVYWPNVRQADSVFLQKTINHYLPAKSPKHQIVSRLNQSQFTRPLAEYGLGLSMVLQRVSGGNTVYYLGQVSNQAFPSYFPVVFLLKETVGFLSLLLLSIVLALYFLPKIIPQIFSWLKIPVRSEREGHLDFIVVSLSLLLAYIILYSYLSITGNLNLGIRHLLPIFPPLIILISFILTKAVNLFQSSRHKLIYKTGIILVLLFLAIETISAYPYYLSFFNRTVGGPKNGYHYVTDSNADWGQDLKRLEKYLDHHPEIKQIHIDYFGGDNPRYRFGSKFIPWWDSRRPIEPGYYAISANFLMNSIYDKNKPDNQSYRWIIKNHLKPITQIGTSILIYKVGKEIN